MEEKRVVTPRFTVHERCFSRLREPPLQSAIPERFLLQGTWWALVPLALAAAAVVVPYARQLGLVAVGMALQQGFALVCHQRPERSLWMFGGALAVCSRCFGIYLGAAFGALLRTSHRIAMRLLIAAAALNLLDVLSGIGGMHGNWVEVRFVLGLLLGATAAMLIASADRANSSLRHNRVTQ